MAEPATRFVLKRLNWAVDYNYSDNNLVLYRAPGEVVLASFATFEEADTECAKRETEARKTINPFTCGYAVHHWTHLDEPRLRDWLMDHGIDPPKPGKKGETNWQEWWPKRGKKLSADKQASVWEILDKVRFFVVREQPARKIGFAVIEINWRFNDETYDADPEGGRLMNVYQSRARAEQACEALNAEARQERGGVEEDAPDLEEVAELIHENYEQYGMVPFDMRDRVRRRRGLFSDQKLNRGEGMFCYLAHTPFYEVIEVELEGIE